MCSFHLHLANVLPERKSEHIKVRKHISRNGMGRKKEEYWEQAKNRVVRGLNQPYSTCKRASEKEAEAQKPPTNPIEVDRISKKQG